MIEDGIAPNAVVNYTEPETQAAFLNGNAVFCRNWPYMYGLLQDPGQSQITPDQVEITTLPRNEGAQSYSGLGGWNMYINAASKGKLDAIWEFIQFMSAPEVIVVLSSPAAPRTKLSEPEQSYPVSS